MTGGTIDGFYDAIGQTAKPGEESAIPRYFEASIRPHLNISFEQVCMKDSQDLSQKDLENILGAVRNAPQDRVIITHGIDTMTDTADFIKENLDSTENKVILLTGSLTPLQGFAKSDSGFNLGFAVSQAQTLSPGIYIAMNAKIFEAGTVYKDVQAARFESK